MSTSATSFKWRLGRERERLERTSEWRPLRERERSIEAEREASRVRVPEWPRERERELDAERERTLGSGARSRGGKASVRSKTTACSQLTGTVRAAESRMDTT